MILRAVQTTLLAIIFVSSFILTTVNSLKCYQCTSNIDFHCTEIFDKEHADIQPKECKVYGATHCVKTTGIYKGEVGTQRFCAPVGWGDVCEIVKRKGDYREYRSCVYTCSGDSCNSGPSIISGNIYLSIFIFSFSIILIPFF